MAKLIWKALDSSHPEYGNDSMWKFKRMIENKFSVDFSDDYHKFWEWSVNNIPTFWEEYFNFSGILCSTNYTQVLEKDGNIDMIEIPKWFIGCKLNYAENMLRFRDDKLAIISFGEENELPNKVTYKQLYEKVVKFALALRLFGIKPGDTIASLLPNVEFAVVAMLATASIGAIWTSASPETQAKGVIMRIKQTNPKILLSYDQVIYGGKNFQQIEKLQQIKSDIETLEAVVITSHLKKEKRLDIGSIDKSIHLEDFMDKYVDLNKTFEQLEDSFVFEQVCFNHPLFIMYSSGTTGIPKGLVHGVGGTLLQQTKDHILHANIKRNDVFFYYTITAWMMWNWTMTALFTGCTLVLFNGSPLVPDIKVLWHIISKYKVSLFGAGAAYYQYLETNHVNVKNEMDLTALRTIFSTGSVLPSHTYEYIDNNIKNSLQIGSIAAATDVFCCFGGVNQHLNVYAGQVQSPNLGMSIYSANSLTGEPVFDIPGELIVTKPFPSMPVFMWNDKNNEKYRGTYFSKFPNCWAQGDYCIMDSKTKGLIMLGRSDATLNPKGVRIGSAEIYNVVEEMDEIEDSLCVGQSFMEDERIILFVKLRPEIKFDQSLVTSIKNYIRETLSPRHMPELVLPIPDVPYTLTGKKIELAVKRIISRENFTIQRESLRNPEALDYFKKLVLDNKL